MTLALVFHISAGKEGELLATVDSPDQGVRGIPVERVVVDGNRLTMEMPAMQARFEGVVEGDRLEGAWNQGGANLPLELERVEVLVGPRRPQEPEPPFPYRTEDLRYPNAEAGIHLAGTLTLPEGRGPFPAVALISGSGAQNRDSEVFGHRLFLVLSDLISRAMDIPVPRRHGPGSSLDPGADGPGHGPGHSGCGGTALAEGVPAPSHPDVPRARRGGRVPVLPVPSREGSQDHHQGRHGPLHEPGDLLQIELLAVAPGKIHAFEEARALATVLPDARVEAGDEPGEVPGRMHPTREPGGTLSMIPELVHLSCAKDHLLPRTHRASPVLTVRASDDVSEAPHHDPDSLILEEVDVLGRPRAWLHESFHDQVLTLLVPLHSQQAELLSASGVGFDGKTHRGLRLPAAPGIPPRP
jgi:hypothetical protein